MTSRQRIAALLLGLLASGTLLYMAQAQRGDRATGDPDAVASARLDLALGLDTRSTTSIDRAPPPELAFEDASGRPLKLSEFRGKLLLLNIWATWCAPCREEMPALDRLQASLGGPDFQVIALSTDVDGATVVRRFYEDLGIEHLGIYVRPDKQDLSKLSLIGLPTTLVIDPRGMEIKRKLGPAEWDRHEMISALGEYIEAP